MKLHALVSFSGIITATGGQDFDCEDDKLAKDLINAGYAKPAAVNTKGGSGSGNAPTTPPKVPSTAKKDEEDKAPATSTSEDNKSGAEKEK